MYRWSVLLLLIAGLTSFTSSADPWDLSIKQERQEEVAMRLIGHHVLLASGDTASLVLPVERTGDRYRIRFSEPFGFDPGKLTATVDSVVRSTGIASRYIVEFVSCDSGQVVHSWQAALRPEQGMMPCMGREQPVACYQLWFTILERDPAAFAQDHVRNEADLAGGDEEQGHTWLLLLIGALALGGLAFVIHNKRRRPAPNEDPNLIRIGEFLFNPRNMELSFKNERVRLTSKEADLLQLLSASPNDTVARETILATVWGDEGDYVGRTLDVFVSKLRKKLEADANVRIVNIRGVGYRLVVE